ncbi:MAG: hypothetical protein ABIH83_04885 [Candidatus Micrarchaeota archaeon]
MKRKKAQANLELLILFAGAMLILALLAVVLPTQAIGSQMVREKQIAQGSVDLVAETADEVYLTGEGAVKHIWIEVPETADVETLDYSFIGAKSGETNWSKKKMVNLYLLVEGDVFAITRAPVCGQWPYTAGRHKVVVEYNGTGNPHVMVNKNC